MSKILLQFLVVFVFNFSKGLIPSFMFHYSGCSLFQVTNIVYCTQYWVFGINKLSFSLHLGALIVLFYLVVLCFVVVLIGCFIFYVSPVENHVLKNKEKRHSRSKILTAAPSTAIEWVGVLKCEAVSQLPVWFHLGFTHLYWCVLSNSWCQK